jgi:hypothetical protein
MLNLELIALLLLRDGELRRFVASGNCLYQAGALSSLCSDSVLATIQHN